MKWIIHFEKKNQWGEYNHIHRTVQDVYRCVNVNGFRRINIYSEEPLDEELDKERTYGINGIDYL